jgi:hypothetical protein
MRAVVALAGLFVLAQAPAPPAGPAPPPAAPPAPPPEAWVQRPIVQLTVLDKMSTHATSLSGKVGEVLHIGSLSIVARACVVRPPDAPADAAAFLDITDAAGTPPFDAWMLLNEPSASIYENPVYDIRLAGCV